MAIINGIGIGIGFTEPTGAPAPVPPVADFSGSPTSINIGDTVAFTDLSTNAPTSWSWSFAGGTPATSTTQNPSVVYNTAGTYNVDLTATNAGGSDLESKPNYITVINPYLLDNYSGAAAAYSVRKLSSSYTGSALRVRRSSDNAEQDIGFVGLDLDTTALASFVGAGNGFVTKWYDQSGNANNGINTIANDQPRIVNSGTIDIVNLLPCINFVSGDFFNLSSPISTLNINYSAFTVGRRPNNTNNRLIYLGTSNTSFAPYISMHFNDGKIYLANRSKYGSYTDTDLNQIQLSSFSISSNLSAYKNSILKTLTVTNFATSGDFNTIGQSGGISGWNSVGEIQEIILYISDKSSDRSGIETNINNYFNIYP